MRTNTSSPIFSHEKEERRRGEKEKINAVPEVFRGGKSSKKDAYGKTYSHILTKLKFVQQLTFSAPAKKNNQVSVLEDFFSDQVG